MQNKKQTITIVLVLLAAAAVAFVLWSIYRNGTVDTSVNRPVTQNNQSANLDQTTTETPPTEPEATTPENPPGEVSPNHSPLPGAKPSKYADKIGANVSGEDVDIERTVEEVAITAAGTKFEPSAVTVRKGDTVKVTFTNNSSTSTDLLISGYAIGTTVLKQGQSESIQFVADKAGTFPFSSTVGGLKAKGFSGNFIVQ